MSAITPTYGIRETGRMIRMFTKEHRGLVWRYFKLYLPWILLFHALDFAISFVPVPFVNQFAVGSLLASYFYTCFIITWHRVILEGPEKAIPVKPFKPEKTDWAFIFMGVGLGVVSTLLTIAIVPLAALGIGGAILGVCIIFAIIVIFAKFSFYFPAKAVRKHLSLKASFKMTTGYVWRIWCAYFMAVWRLCLALMAYFIITGVVLGSVAMTGQTIFIVISIVLGILTIIPIYVYFYPLLMAMGVGVLSNYYQHALLHK